jgi:hypothetical protein
MVVCIKCSPSSDCMSQGIVAGFTSRFSRKARRLGQVWLPFRIKE